MSQENQQQSSELAQAPKRDMSMMVEDSGPYNMLLDTRRFDQMWRVASMYSKTAMVPSHYQGHPADCFIACQMAMRLGVDPMMFMQASYVVHGRPGMEAKFVIALINTSGLFAGPLGFEITGTGQDRGCVAQAKWKTTGEVVRGPRVDMKMAAAEGWTKNQKWQSMTDLMLAYRSAAFFGRTVCPERLMGMSTLDELEDMIDVLPTSATTSPATQDLSEKLKKGVKHVVSTQVAAPAVAQVAPAVASASDTAAMDKAFADKAAADAQAAVDAVHEQAEAPHGTDAPPPPKTFANYEAFRLVATELAMVRQWDEGALNKWLKGKLLAAGKMKPGQEATIHVDTLGRWYAELEAKETV